MTTRRGTSPSDNYGNPRICLVVLELPIGGLERALIHLANGLQARGIPARVVVMENEDNTLIVEISKEVEVICLECSLVSKLLRLRQLARGHLIHFHFWGGHVRPLYRLALLGQGPMLSTYQNVYTRMRGRFWTLVDRFMSRQLRAVVAVSNTVKDYCVDIVGIPESKVHVIYNGVEVGPAAPHPDWTGRNLRLISVARMVKQKDHRTLIRGIAVARRLGCNLRLTLIGDGPEKPSLIHLASALGVLDTVTWLGEVWLREEVRALIRRADAFVTASVWEGFPIAVLEAMSEGLPVVASDIQPHREALADCAVYFPPSDSEALGRALTTLYHDSALGHRMGAKTHQRAGLFNVDRVVDEHIQLYRSVM